MPVFGPIFRLCFMSERRYSSNLKAQILAWITHDVPVSCESIVHHRGEQNILRKISIYLCVYLYLCLILFYSTYTGVCSRSENDQPRYRAAMLWMTVNIHCKCDYVRQVLAITKT